MSMVETPEVEMAAPEKLELKPERVQQALAKLPSWRLSKDGLSIESERSFATAGRMSSFAAYACRLATKLGQPVTVDLADRTVLVTLPGHPRCGCTGGLTDPVFKLADLIGS
jgi:pterin-4a-carbinolamine dehydratase